MRFDRVFFSKKTTKANMKEHIETSLVQVSVGLYRVPVRSYDHFKSDQKSLTFFVHVENERSIA